MSKKTPTPGKGVINPRFERLRGKKKRGLAKPMEWEKTWRKEQGKKKRYFSETRGNIHRTQLGEGTRKGENRLQGGKG